MSGDDITLPGFPTPMEDEYEKVFRCVAKSIQLPAVAFICEKCKAQNIVPNPEVAKVVKEGKIALVLCPQCQGKCELKESLIQVVPAGAQISGMQIKK